MSALDKLINLLEELKQTSPDLRGKASKALDALVSSDNSPEPKPVSEPVPEPQPEPQPEPEPEPEREPEPFDDSYIEFEWSVCERLIDKQRNINDLVEKLGRKEIENRRIKEAMINKIASDQASLNQETKDVMKSIGCDMEATYTMKIPENDDELPAFKKK